MVSFSTMLEDEVDVMIPGGTYVVSIPNEHGMLPVPQRTAELPCTSMSSNASKASVFVPLENVIVTTSSSVRLGLFPLPMIALLPSTIFQSDELVTIEFELPKTAAGIHFFFEGCPRIGWAAARSKGDIMLLGGVHDVCSVER